MQKVLLTEENRSTVKELLRRYQQVATSSSSLAPLLAAFVPPRDSHVLYLVSPGLNLVRNIVGLSDLMKVSHTLLGALYDLSSQDICCSMARPLQFLGRLQTEPEQRIVLLPNFNQLDANIENDLTNIINILNVSI